MERPTYREPFDSPEHRLIEKYIRVTRLYRGMVEYQLEETGVYRSQRQILVCVSGNPNVSQKELAGMYGISGVTIAVSLKRLGKGDYISRLVGRNDSRCNQIYITKRGKRMVEDSVSIFQHMELSMFERFSENDGKVLRELLDRICENLQHIPNERKDN